MTQDATERDVVFWSCSEDNETLEYTDRDEALENHLADWIGSQADLDEFERVHGATIDVYGYARQVAKLEPAWLLEVVLEELDSTQMLGDPDGSPKPKPAMVEAAEAFCAAMLAEYVPWACDLVVTETVNVREWITENCPEWLGQ